ncbi:hypothetical protein EON65_12360 [archaeon]|nr:MAG: hypothetical protein EON65_12360 [archaeon]
MLLWIGAPTNNDPDTLVQYFIRDPDGYYLELCNCSILNGFCLDNYREGLPDQHYSLPSLSVLTRFVRRVVKARNFTPPSHEDILRSAKRAEREDEEKAQKLLQRRRVYGDICQGFTEGELRETLRQAGNHVPTAILLLKHNTKSNVKIPPKFQAYDPEAGRVTTTHPPAVDFTNMKKQDAEATN